MESACAIEISDDEGTPTPADESLAPDEGSKMNGSHLNHDSDAHSNHSSEEYDYPAPEDEVNLNDVSLHASDLEGEDIFADNFKRYTELQRQAEEKLAAAPVPRTPSPEQTSGAAKRSAQQAGGRGKRQRTESADTADGALSDDDDLDLEKLLASSPVVTPTTRRTRSGRVLKAPVSQASDTEGDKADAVVLDSPLFPSQSPIEELKEPEPEPEPTFTARVQAGRLIIRLQMKRTDRLQRLFDAVADELSLPSRRVCLGQRDIIYSPHQTPDDVGLGPFDMIEFWEGNSAPTTAPVPESAAAVVDPDSIELKVQSADRRSTVMIRLKAADPMSLLMERYAAEKGVSLDQLRFRFDGEALDPTDTPETLDLEGGECIDVHGR